MGFVERIITYIERRELVEEGDVVVVAVSGGGDSVAMLHALDEVSEHLGCRLHVAHLDHGLRPESAEEAEFVARLAGELGLQATIRRVNMAARLDREGGSIEMLARERRYEFFAEVAEETGAGRVATGHTADDQAETVLHNILRGAELRGIAGIPALRPLAPGCSVRVIRPLLGESRTSVLGYLAEKGLDFRTDPSNADTSFTRNRLRCELLPFIEERFNPSVADALVRTGELARAALRIARPHLERLADDITEEGALRCDELMTVDEPLRRPVVETALARLLPDLHLGYQHGQAIVDLARAEEGTAVTLPGGRHMRKAGGRLEFVPDEPVLPPLDDALPVPGRLRAVGGRLEISAERISAGDGFLEGFIREKSRWEEVIDGDRAGSGFRVRWKRDGDRFRPLGAPGSKKLKDFFIDAKVDAVERKQTPVVVTDAGIVWVVGHRIDERVRVTGATKRMLLLRARWRTELKDE